MIETETRRTRGKTLTVWVGFCDGKPHIYDDTPHGDVRTVAVYPSQRAAMKCYEDVRKYELRPVRSRRTP